MNEVNRTLYIPLYGKSCVSKKGIILRDPKAEYIWQKEGFALKGKSRSKWLAYSMGMRAAVFDRWTREQLEQVPEAVVLHIGCGMDSRCERIGKDAAAWYDVDFPDVISERKRYYTETHAYHMIPADARSVRWIRELPSGHAIVVMEGLSMYLTEADMQRLLSAITAHFESVSLLVDCYTSFGAKASKDKNPINDVGVTAVYGVDDPHVYEQGTGMKFVRAHSLTPDTMIDELEGMERAVFRYVFAGSFAQRIYRLYEFEARRKQPAASKLSG